MIRIYNKGIKRNLAGYARGLFSKSSEEVTSSLLTAVSKEEVTSSELFENKPRAYPAKFRFMPLL